MTGLTTVQTAHVVGALQWTTGRLFEMLGQWAGDADRPDVAVALATTSRHLGWHHGDIVELMPDSVLIADETEVRPHAPEIAHALDAIAAIGGSTERLAIAHRVLLARLAAHCSSVERATSVHADASLGRVVEFLLTDLRRDRDESEGLLGVLLHDVATVEQVNAAVLEAESRLVSAGGLFPIGPPV